MSPTIFLACASVSNPLRDLLAALSTSWQIASASRRLVCLVERLVREPSGVVKQHLDAGEEVDAKDDKFVGTFLHWAAAGGQNEIVELLIAEGADVNATDGDGDTPLHLAGNTTTSTEIAELLISKGADVNAMNLSPPGRRIGGMTPLDMATLGNRTEIADLLRKHGGKTRRELKAEGK